MKNLATGIDNASGDTQLLTDNLQPNYAEAT